MKQLGLISGIGIVLLLVYLLIQVFIAQDKYAALLVLILIELIYINPYNRTNKPL